MKSQRQSYIYALLAVLCWSTIGSAFKISLRYLDFLNLLLYSSLFAACFHFCSLFIGKKIRIIVQIRRKDLIYSAFLGLLNPFLYYVVLLRAYELLPAQEAGTLNYIWPLVLVFFSIPLLHQKISPWSIVALLVSFSGILIISTHGHLAGFHFSSPSGVILAVVSAIFWALYWIYNVKDPHEESSRLFLNFCFGFLYIFLFLIFTRGIVIPSWKGWAGSLYLGCFEMGIPFFLWMKALKLSATTAKVSNLIYLSPFISLIFIHFIVGETILLSTIAGLGLIIGGIILQQYLKK